MTKIDILFILIFLIIVFGIYSVNRLLEIKADDKLFQAIRNQHVKLDKRVSDLEDKVLELGKNIKNIYEK